MRYPGDLQPATLLRRYKRFLADVRFAHGREETVHCPNPGGMRGCGEPGRPVLVSFSDNPRRKLRGTLEMIRMGRTWVGVNTQVPNRVIGRLLERRAVPGLNAYGTLAREVPCGHSRIDFVLSEPTLPTVWIEVKNSTWRVPGPTRYAAFPDAVTARGRRHLDTLIERVRTGDRAMMLFHVGRADVRRFRPADEVDPAYGAALRAAIVAGVEALALRFRYGPGGIRLLGSLPIDLDRPGVGAPGGGGPAISS